jgi:hypothetical protein
MNEKMINDLIKSIPALASTGNTETLNRVLDLINELKNAKPVTTQQSTAGKYVYARVLTLENGEKHYHPLVGGMYPSNNIEDYKMEAYDSIIALQDSPAASLAKMASSTGYKMQILYMPNDVYEALEVKLNELVTTIFNAVDEGVKHLEQAAAIMGNPMAEGTLKAMALQQLMSRPVVSGVGVTATNEIVDKADYVDQELPEPNYEDDYDYDEEDDWDEDDWDDDDDWDDEDEDEDDDEENEEEDEE